MPATMQCHVGTVNSDMYDILTNYFNWSTPQINGLYRPPVTCIIIINYYRGTYMSCLMLICLHSKIILYNVMNLVCIQL